jgi:hypothetical protein
MASFFLLPGLVAPSCDQNRTPLQLQVVGLSQHGLEAFTRDVGTAGYVASAYQRDPSLISRALGATHRYIPGTQDNIVLLKTFFLFHPRRAGLLGSTLAYVSQP